ncbi:site-specific integrase [Umezawaea sp. Da 62-37]|uniref:tyrosine-type recombinase/integrase n=1 Tax=Umezawaea sp. Da 62-37 TaxID=3075927 RepID=UPI0028F74ABB|nr:site-specific integrase [Umezawaea sp. Da 62-37]WNV84752.1 site-specific integrase [Umezawaea sp. Da 62-37]
MNPAADGPVDVDTARMLLARLGVSIADLLEQPEPKPLAPTFGEYIPIVSNAVPSGSRRAYAPYWNRVSAHWGDRRIDDVTPSDIAALAERVKRAAVQRRNARGGNSAAEHLITALRCLYQHAIADGLVDDATNPAAKVAKPRRQASTRRGLPDVRVVELLKVASTTGNDPPLDALLLRLHIETACRRGGALGLRLVDVDEQQCLVLLREKGETQRWQPVSPTLVAHLVAHAVRRGGDHGGPLLRYINGNPITKRRYDYLWGRLGKSLPWVRTQQVSMHWLRHTTLTWVERNFGYAVARAFAGHSSARDTGTTSTYVRASIEEVSTALSALTNEAHPLAESSRRGPS